MEVWMSANGRNMTVQHKLIDAESQRLREVK